ncbi:MAG: hemerythrin family protein [Eubacterium sp.]|nr:hemerythrin family protein [Eubacterium sp.]MDD7208711.1 hemerythrin family protein [Lachnospiraceae bacterium]MDY5496495.1 hemerythrin family protein [Anaerobutyricum sp.]
MYIEFDDSLITGNDTIDSQHKELISHIQKFVNSCENDSSTDSAEKMLQYLIDYTNFHFTAEEKLQEDVSYPGLKEHKAKHEEFKETLHTLSDKLAAEGTSKAFAEEIKESVTSWLFNHIKVFDRSVAEFINLYENPDRL